MVQGMIQDAGRVVDASLIGGLVTRHALAGGWVTCHLSAGLSVPEWDSGCLIGGACVDSGDACAVDVDGSGEVV